MLPFVTPPTNSRRNILYPFIFRPKVGNKLVYVLDGLNALRFREGIQVWDSVVVDGVHRRSNNIGCYSCSWLKCGDRKYCRSHTFYLPRVSCHLVVNMLKHLAPPVLVCLREAIQSLLFHR